jgi:hypothetical protein
MSDRERWTRRTWALALAWLLAAGAVSAQSLAEAAKREKERRAKSGPSGPAFTDEDLKQHGEAAVSTSGDPADAAGKAAGEGASGDKSGTTRSPAGAGDEAYWRGRAKARRDAVAAAEARVAKAQAGADNTPAGIRQPLPSDAMKQVPRSTATDSAHLGAEAELEAAKAELARARKALDDLEDEARRKSILPGWLR